jgi:ammonium transporter, Amt family
VGTPGAFVIGIGAGLVCLWGVTGLKKLIPADDSLDVFGIHALGGVFGALMTGIFNAPALGGPGSVDWASGATAYPGVLAQLLIQLKAVCLVLVWTAVVAFVGFYLVNLLMGLRVAEEDEREGLDITSHGERAYDL